MVEIDLGERDEDEEGAAGSGGKGTGGSSKSFKIGWDDMRRWGRWADGGGRSAKRSPCPARGGSWREREENVRR